MFGIGTKSAKLVAAAALAVGIGAAGVPAIAEAGDGHRHHRGHKFHGHKFHGGHHFKHRFRHRHHARRHHHGHRHSRFVLRFGSIFPPPPVIHHYPVARACHPVVGHGVDRFGRRAKFGGTMCYDRFGNGYVVAGSRHVIHYF